MSRWQAGVAFVWIMIPLSSCGLVNEVIDPTPPPVPIASAHKSKPSDGKKIRRVAVLPFQDLTGHPREAETLRQSLAEALQKKQQFEIVVLDEKALVLADEEAFFKTGRVQKDTLIRVARQFRADGVLYGALTVYRAYEPMALGAQLTLVSAGVGDIVWSSNAIFDSKELAVTQDVRNYHDTELASSTNLEGWRLILGSPSRFSAYAAARIAATL